MSLRNSITPLLALFLVAFLVACGGEKSTQTPLAERFNLLVGKNMILSQVFYDIGSPSNPDPDYMNFKLGTNQINGRIDCSDFTALTNWTEDGAVTFDVNMDKTCRGITYFTFEKEMRYNVKDNKLILYSPGTNKEAHFVIAIDPEDE